MIELPICLCRCALLSVLCLVSLAGRTVWSDEAESNETAGLAAEKLAAWNRSGWQLMQTYCLDCHNTDLQEGGLDLSPFGTLENLSAAEITRVLEMVQFGAMPPEDYDLPETEERKQLVLALEQNMYSASCDLRPRAGKVTARRLNRNEYNNTIRDLFGLDLRPAEAFPSDEVGAGFDNNGDVLSLSPMLIEKYLDAAESVAEQVIIDPATLPRLRMDIPGDQLTVYGEPKVGSFSGRFVRSGSFAWLDAEIPVEGEYSVTVRGGASKEDDVPSKLAVCDHTGMLLKVVEFKYYGGGGRSDSERVTVKLERGKQRLYFLPIEDEEGLVAQESRLEAFEAIDPKREAEIVAARGEFVEPTRGFDRDEYRFMFRSIQMDGPRAHPASSYPPKQFELVRHVAPRSRDRYRDVEKFAGRNLEPLMRKMFRSPVGDDDVKPYAALVAQATKEGESFYRGMQIAVSALLVSPRFLFRVETPPTDSEPNEFGDLALTQHQLAARLSYFLWSSTPDERLLEHALQQTIMKPALR